MSWVKIDDQLHAHAKHVILSLAAEGLWTRCISWVGDKETDGFIPSAIARLHAGAQFGELSAELVDAGLWIPSDCGKGFHYHDYLEYNKSHAQLEEERRATAARQGKFRESKRYKNSNNGDSNGVTPPVTNDPVTPAPDPVSRPRIPVPDIYASTEIDQTDDSGGSGGESPPPAPSVVRPSPVSRNGKLLSDADVARALAENDGWEDVLTVVMRTTMPTRQSVERHRAGIVTNWVNGDGTPTRERIAECRTILEAERNGTAPSRASPPTLVRPLSAAEQRVANARKLRAEIDNHDHSSIQ